MHVVKVVDHFVGCVNGNPLQVSHRRVRKRVVDFEARFEWCESVEEAGEQDCRLLELYRDVEGVLLVVTVMENSFVAAHADRSGHSVELRDHVIVAGFGPAAAELVPALQLRQIPFAVTTLNPQAGDVIAGAGALLLQGDASKPNLLERASVRTARLLVISDDEAEAIARIARVAREMNPQLRIVALVDDHEHVRELHDAGVTDIVAARRSGQLEMIALVARQAAGPRSRGAGEVVVFHADPGAPCTHTSDVGVVVARTSGCEECLALGERWIHLRVCLSCGHVGCCDDSPGRHARAHASSTRHSVVASFEHGEHWAWCYTDEIELSEPTNG